MRTAARAAKGRDLRDQISKEFALDVKRFVMGTRLGRAALSIRSSVNVLKTAYYHPEISGMIANDRMAEQLATRLCRPSRTVVDVGAHIGSFFSEVLDHEPTARVVAIEAMPDKIAILRRKFPGVTFHECAVSEAKGTATFYINHVSSGFSSLGRPVESLRSQVTEITVAVERLDDLLSSSEVDMIKIDVEGGELGVLRGAERLVADSRPAILFESGSGGFNDLNYPWEDLWQWFDDRDIAVLVPNRLAHFDDGLSREGFLESHHYPCRTTNYFAIPREHRLEIRSRARRILGFPD